MELSITIRAKEGLHANLPTQGAVGEFFWTKDTKKLFLGNGVGQPLTEIGGVTGHTQNTDTGTTSVSFVIDSDSVNPVILKNNAGAIEFRNGDDTDFASIRVKDLTVKGTTTTIESETLKVADNIIELNSNIVTGAPTENAGIEIKRGDELEASLLFNETLDKWQAGIKGSERTIVFDDDARIGTKAIDETGLTAGDVMVYDGTKFVRATGISGGNF